MRARPAHGERERPGALGSVRGALDSTQTQQTDNSVPSALLRPPSGYSVNRLLGPGDGRRERVVQGGRVGPLGAASHLWFPTG